MTSRKATSVTGSSDQPTTHQQTIVQNIDQFLEEGMPVFDLNDERVGDVKMYSTAAGYLMLGSGPVGQQDLYIPFRLIRNIDPDQIYLSAAQDVRPGQGRQTPIYCTVGENTMVPTPQRS